MQVGLHQIAKPQRVPRYPKHTFNIRHKPFVIQPFMIAPVLAGDTMKSLLFQYRAQTEQLANQLIGWWAEHFFFYVPLRALPSWTTLEAMLLDNGSVAGIVQAADVDTYHCDANAPDYVDECLVAITEHFFRDEGQAWNASGTTIDSNPIASAKVSAPGWLNSTTLETVFDDNDPGMPEDAGTDTMEELDRRRLQWEFLRSQNITQMEYEDYLKTFGVKLQAQEGIIKPELLRHTRAWQLPSSAVDGATGATSTVVSWAGQERADKDRFFKQPGFIVGVTVVRPKVYFNNVKGAAVSLLRDALTWLPRMLQHEAAISLKEIAAGLGPLDDSSAAYIVDTKDIFLHGDQFLNYALTATDANLVSLPSDDLTNWFYPSSTDIDGLFASANTTNLVHQDGIVSLTIHSTLVDTSPSQAVLG